MRLLFRLIKFTKCGEQAYLAPVRIGSPNGAGFTAKQVEEIINHIKQGYPASVSTGRKETTEMKHLGLHTNHCYPILDWIGPTDGAAPGADSDYLTIRNPHNRISIKNTVPNLGVELEQEHAFWFGKVGGWGATQKALSLVGGGAHTGLGQVRGTV